MQPPEWVDPATGVAWLPFSVHEALQPECCCNRAACPCCPTPNFAPFGPELIQMQSYRATAYVPEPLRAVGIDQPEFSGMLEDFKTGMSQANWCGETLEGVLDKIEVSIKPRANNWCIANLNYSFLFRSSLNESICY